MKKINKKRINNETSLNVFLTPAIAATIAAAYWVNPIAAIVIVAMSFGYCVVAVFETAKIVIAVSKKCFKIARAIFRKLKSKKVVLKALPALTQSQSQSKPKSNNLRAVK